MSTWGMLALACCLAERAGVRETARHASDCALPPLGTDCLIRLGFSRLQSPFSTIPSLGFPPPVLGRADQASI